MLYFNKDRVIIVNALQSVNGIENAQMKAA